MSNKWLVLIISLPGRNTAPRMRIWRSLKASGAAILRDGVYLLPDTDRHHLLLEEQAGQVKQFDGNAHLLTVSSGERQSDQFRRLFDRSLVYRQWNEQASSLKERLKSLDESKARREESQLRRELESIISTDFFTHPEQDASSIALEEISADINRCFSPDEPVSTPGIIKVLNKNDFCSKLWATRQNLWVDRVASAWLIKRHIDQDAEFVWLKKPGDCPPDALGFDFDGATFSHLGHRVTFEVLMASFALEKNPALSKMGVLVHYLDVGGVSVPEAQGFITLLAGTKQQAKNDDDFAQQAFVLLDTLYTAYGHSSGDK